MKPKTIQRIAKKPGGIKAELEGRNTEIKKLRIRLCGIEDALKNAGLFAFEHIDGTFSIVKR